MKTKIKIASLTVDRLQVRGITVEEVVEDYADAMKRGEKFPPVIVYTDGVKNYLADGFHRVMAASHAGKTSIEADVREGTFAEAKRFAASANAKNGLRMTNAMKRNCLSSVMDDRAILWGEGVFPSAEILAETCGCGTTMAQEFLTEWYRTNLPTAGRLNTPPPVRKVIGKDGKTRTLPPVPVRRVGMDGKTRSVPPPTRPTTPPVKPGYHIRTDGKTHADGVTLDRFNVEIPEALASVFSDDCLDKWTKGLQAIKIAVHNAIESGNPIARSLQRCEMQMSDAYHELKAAKPFCVCRMCQGQGCQACGEVGFQTEDQYNRNPSEFKA